MYNDQGVRAAAQAHPNAMVDDAHPTQEGYLKIWLPVFEKKLSELM